MWRFAFLLLALVCVAFGATPEYRSMGADIFDPKTPGEQLVATAITQAQKEKKHVLLFFGANWCPWCRRLHAALTKDVAIQAELKERFVLVFIDANTRNDKSRNADLLARYGNPTLEFGLPVFVILDRDGKHIGTRETASLSADTDAVTNHDDRPRSIE